MSIKEWIETNRLDAIVWDERTFSINNFGKFLIIEAKTGIEFTKIVDEDFRLIFDEADIAKINEDESIDFFAFEFGNNWYYGEGDGQVKELKLLRYLGKEVECFNDFPILGIHGGYDLCNGSRDYKDWIAKAKFCNVDVIGVCEENTLAGTLAFQNACESKKINFILGETVTVKDDFNEQYNVKLYVVNEIGWRNLLLINTQINVVNDKFITESELFKHSAGLYCILTPEVDLKTKYSLYSLHADIMFEGIYYQLDIAQWDSDEKDKKWLLSTQDYLKNYLNVLEPILISDMYYLEKEDGFIRKELNAIGGVTFKNQSKDQYFKTPNELFNQLLNLFDGSDERAVEICNKALTNAKVIGATQFKIETGKLHLPQYIMSETESKQFSSNEELFWHLIEKGLQDKIIDKNKDVDLYVERIKEETDVILSAKLHDYFLITWDILNFCTLNGIKTGYGRGSAGGSVVAYLLNIVKVDPLEYGLLFSRFLNAGRLFKKKKVECLVLDTENGDIEVDFDENIVILENEREREIKARDLQMGMSIVKIGNTVC